MKTAMHWTCRPLYLGAALSALIAWNTVAHSQTSRNSTPILNVDVSLRASDGGVYHTKTNFSGNFKFSNVPSGSYTLLVSQSALQEYILGQSKQALCQGSACAFLKLDCTESLRVKTDGKAIKAGVIKVFPSKTSIKRIAIEQPKAGPLTGSIYALSGGME